MWLPIEVLVGKFAFTPAAASTLVVEMPVRFSLNLLLPPEEYTTRDSANYESVGIKAGKVRIFG
jgi:hypothetical protein